MRRLMNEFRTIRMTQDLKDMIDATAAKCGITLAEVLRAVAHGMRTGRPVNAGVVNTEKMKVTTKPGDVIVGGFGGIFVPDMTTSATLRKQIYLRCAEELNREPRQGAKRPAPEGIEGVDYNVPPALAAARLMEAAE